MTSCFRRARSRAAARAAARSFAIVLAATAVSAQAPAAQGPDELRAELAAIQRRTALLERELELARGDAFYLVLDPGAPDLALMLRGAELQRYPILGLQVGRPRVSWVRRAVPGPWQGVTWSGGELDPPRQLDRVVVQAAEPGAEGEEPKPPVIPPTAEELYTVPARYHIRFEGGPSIEIRPREADAGLGRWARFRAWWSAKWRDVAAAIWSADRDGVRVRIVLNPKDAESLYRALPPATSLLVL